MDKRKLKTGLQQNTLTTTGWLLGTCAMCLLFSTAALADIQVYIPFDYPIGGLDGQSSTNDLGVTGTWTAGASSKITTNTLAYSTVPVQGRSIGELNSGSNAYGGSRGVDPTALRNIGLLDDGATLWFSLVLGYGPGGNLTNSRFGFSLANNAFSSGNFQYYILDDGPLKGDSIGLTLGRVSGVNGYVFATQFRDSTFGTSGFSGNVLGTQEGTQTLYGADEHGLIVGKITWAATNDVIELYQPDTNLNLGPIISTLTVSVTQTNFDTLTWSRGDVIVLDEIRFGSNYENVLGVFDPPKGTVITLY